MEISDRLLKNIILHSKKVIKESGTDSVKLKENIRLLKKDVESIERQIKKLNG